MKIFGALYQIGTHYSFQYHGIFKQCKILPGHKPLKTIYRIEREVKTFIAKTKGYETSNGTAYYVSNGELPFQHTFSCIQKHWLIENSNHYLRDVSHQEDFSRIRVKADNMARLRSFV